ncbi:uncharacterized protein LOC128508276 [Clarias gariepinus]|uniref:uncharacterized protein LOC128508276 n=1 Tax=Clarias gariepinus TaxID=13013 RepID=UPI00234C3E0C|nr:uncharacterized protein LOC128508276 [Clarias gariepinus]
MGTRGLTLCLTLSLVLASVCCIKDLESLNDLMDKIKQTAEGFPRIEGIMLLCTIYRNSKIDQNGRLRLNADPTDLTCHPYENYEGTFPDLKNTNFGYYSFGNLRDAKNILPPCFYKRITKQRNNPQNNIDRIVIRVKKNIRTLVDEVYITQHAVDRNLGSNYVQQLTYRISEKLFNEIKELCLNIEDEYCQEEEDEDKDKDKDRDKIKTRSQSRIHESASNSQTSSKHSTSANVNNADNNANKHANLNSQAKSANIKLKLRSTWSGKVRIVWDGIPDEMLRNKIKICVYKSKDEEIPLVEYAIDGRAHGEIDTDLDLNPGLQLRLLKPITVYETVYESPEFDGSKSEIHHSAPSSFFTFISLVLWPFRSLFSLVFFILSNLFSLVYSIFSIILSLIYFIVTTPFSLVYIGFRELFSLVYRILSFLNSSVDSVIGSLLSLVYVIVSSVFPPLHIVCHEFVLISALCQLISVVLPVVLKLCVVFICIVLIGAARKMFVEVTQNRTRAAPHFVDVSQGRPSF